MDIFKKEKPQADAPASTWEENKYLYYAVMKPDRLAAEMERKRIVHRDRPANRKGAVCAAGGNRLRRPAG